MGIPIITPPLPIIPIPPTLPIPTPIPTIPTPTIPTTNSTFPKRYWHEDETLRTEFLNKCNEFLLVVSSRKCTNSKKRVTKCKCLAGMGDGATTSTFPKSTTSNTTSNTTSPKTSKSISTSQIDENNEKGGGAITRNEASKFILRHAQKSKADQQVIVKEWMRMAEASSDMMKAFIRSRGGNSGGSIGGTGGGGNNNNVGGSGSGSGKRIRSQYLLHGVYRRDGKGGLFLGDDDDDNNGNDNVDDTTIQNDPRHENGDDNNTNKNKNKSNKNK